MCSEEFVALELREKSWIKESSMKTTVSTQPLTTRSNISDISLLRVNVSQENVFSQLTENDLSIVNVPLRRVIESYR